MCQFGRIGNPGNHNNHDHIMMMDDQ